MKSGSFQISNVLKVVYFVNFNLPIQYFPKVIHVSVRKSVLYYFCVLHFWESVCKDTQLKLEKWKSVVCDGTKKT